MIRAVPTVSLAWILTAFSVWCCVAQEIPPRIDFELLGRVSGGGGVSEGGEFRVVGGIPTTSAGQSVGDDFVLTGGFVELFTVPTETGVITLGIALTTVGVRISWPGQAGVTLEATAVLGPGANWQPIQTAAESIELRLDQRARFFRLRRP